MITTPPEAQPRPIEADDLLAACERMQQDQAVRQLWQIADSGCRAPWRGPNTDVVLRAVEVQAQRLKRLLTENTAIRRQPFSDLLAGIAEIFRMARDNDGRRISAAAALNRLCEQYRWTPGNFRPLTATRRTCVGRWGAFVGCVVDGREAFFIVASGEPTAVLVHFDIWAGEEQHRQQLAGRYAAALDRQLEQQAASVVLVKKELGPAGPAAIWKDIAARMQRRPGAILEYDQASAHFSASPDAPSRAVVLYDLWNTGDGLQDIARDLHRQAGLENLGAVILYRYRARASETIGFSHVDVLFEHDELAPEELERTLGHCEPSADGASAAQSPFTRVQPHHVDPVRAASPDFSRDVATLSRDSTRAKYAGRWVICSGGAIVAAAGTLPQLLRSEAAHRPGRLIHYFADPR